MRAIAPRTLARACGDRNADRRRSSGARWGSCWRCSSRPPHSRWRARTPGASATGIVHALVCAVQGGCDGARLARPRIRRRRRRAGAPLLAEHGVRAQQRRAADRLPALPQDRLLGRLRRGARRSTARAPGCRSPPSRAWWTGARGGGPLYLQYWFYYPESFTGAIGRDVRRQLAGISPGRLGGLSGARLARRRVSGARHGARRLRRGLGAVDGLDARVRRQPRRPGRAARAAASAAPAPRGSR